MSHMPFGLTPFETGSLALQGLSTVAAFGSSYGKDERDAVKDQYRYYGRYGPGIESKLFDAKMASFEKHGIHPLFGLSGASGGGAPGFSMPGQSPRGGVRSDALARLAETVLRIGEKQADTNYLAEQRKNSAIQVIDNKIGNDNAFALRRELKRQQRALNPMQEYKKGEVQAHREGRTEQSQNVRRVFHLYEYGPHKVWLPIEEISELMENPVKILGMAETYHGNKGVDWAGVWYYHRNGTMKGYKTPKQHYDKNKRDFQQRRRERKYGDRWKMENRRIQILRNRAG